MNGDFEFRGDTHLFETAQQSKESQERITILQAGPGHNTRSAVGKTSLRPFYSENPDLAADGDSQSDDVEGMEEPADSPFVLKGKFS